MLQTMDFKASMDLVEEIKPALAAAPTGLAPLLGTWKNCDATTRGIVRLVIGAARPSISVHVFGACHPTPCDWGTMPGHSYATDVTSKDAVAFTATYKFDFKETVITGSVNRAGYMTVETFDHFTDGSGRSDYYTKSYFRH